MSLKSLGTMATIPGVVSLVSSGGTGNSTTLIQLAERMCAVGGPVPVYVPLGERTVLLTCIIQYGNVEDLDLATSVAMNEPDPKTCGGDHEFDPVCAAQRA